MWKLRTVKGGDKALSISDIPFSTKREMMRAVSLMTVGYQRRIGNMLIVHVIS